MVLPQKPGRTRKLRLLLALSGTAFALIACRGDGPQTATAAADGLDLDQACRQAVGTAFLSEESFYLGEIESGSYYGPRLISFLSDGRVLWRAGVEPVFGTYTCAGGEFSASFQEGDIPSLEAEFDPETMTLTVDGRDFLPETDS